MRALWIGLGLSLLVGCGKPIEGYWDLVEWEVSRDGESVVRDDAGWLMFQADSTRGFGMLLRYDYVSEPLDLVPTADPGEVGGGFDVSGYRYDRNEPEVKIRFDQEGFATQLDFDIVQYRGAEMVLETATANADGSHWRWALVR